MSEYIVELNDNAVAGGKFLLGSVYLDATQIVRCRDCRMFGDCEWNYENEPMGFCSWGYVLKEGGDD